MPFIEGGAANTRSRDTGFKEEQRLSNSLSSPANTTQPRVPTTNRVSPYQMTRDLLTAMSRAQTSVDDGLDDLVGGDWSADKYWELPQSANAGVDAGVASKFFGDLSGFRARQKLMQAVNQPGDLGLPGTDGELSVGGLETLGDVSSQTGQASSAASRFVSIASKLIGVDYVWGGESPSGVDCSGLIQWAFKQMGVDVPRVSRDQARVGKAVSSLMEALPGDLIAFNTKRTGGQVGHIGIYVGGGKMLHAPRTGTKVQIASIGNRTPAAIRRIV